MRFNLKLKLDKLKRKKQPEKKITDEERMEAARRRANSNARYTKDKKIKITLAGVLVFIFVRMIDVVKSKWKIEYEVANAINSKRYLDRRVVSDFYNIAASKVHEQTMINYYMLQSSVLLSLGLTDRECEVAFYLVQGASFEHTRKMLSIAEGTLKTHMNKIYKKTNVHSRQELTYLVNNRLHQYV